MARNSHQALVGNPRRGPGGDGRPGQRPIQRRRGKRGGVPVNDDIQAEEVRLLGQEKEALGIMSTPEAQALADEAGLDLVLVSMDADPPVARITDFGKLAFQQDKKKKAQRKAALQTRSEMKEVKMRPNTDVADYNVRVKRAVKFLGKGNSVKLTIQFSGRDFDFRNKGFELVERFEKDLEEVGRLEGRANFNGGNMTAIFKPGPR